MRPGRRNGPDVDDEAVAGPREIDDVEHLEDDERIGVAGPIRPTVRRSAVPAPGLVALLDAVRPTEASVRRDEELRDDVAGMAGRDRDAREDEEEADDDHREQQV